MVTTKARTGSLHVAANLCGGTYATNATITIGRNGTAANPIRLRAYPGELPILDFSSQTFTSINYGIRLTARWWHISGLEIVGAGDNGISITGHSNVVERCVIHDCRDSGVQISPSGSYNLVTCGGGGLHHSPISDATGTRLVFAVEVA